ncbi:hypothetical protein Sango_0869400 [Sesamum angolense]|uniref:Endonuclease/exonuclease/phosphatase domain-containing protein n=1 Tax=Sesamum angolense TaxID=2727404 RepID=A0AAE1X459_9LAMI|nr:hypothetical protein Sango_0869400 [Sesamum angolense]
MRIIAWNCRGLARPAAKRMLQELLSSHKPDIVFMCEVKTAHTDKLSSLLRISNMPNFTFAPVFNKGALPAIPTLKPFFWQCFHDIYSSFDGPWLAMEDFNEILSQNEEREGKHFASAFRNTLYDEFENCNLIDLGFTGNNFTWNNRRPGLANIQSHLDRGVANTDWCLLFPKTIITYLPAIASDHCSIFLDNHPNTANQPRPFLF